MKTRPFATSPGWAVRVTPTLRRALRRPRGTREGFPRTSGSSHRARGRMYAGTYEGPRPARCLSGAFRGWWGQRLALAALGVTRRLPDQSLPALTLLVWESPAVWEASLMSLG